MRDPFKPSSNKQLIREAQFGFTVIGLLVATLVYVAWYRLNGFDDVTPEHIRNSPVATQVYPTSPTYKAIAQEPPPERAIAAKSTPPAPVDRNANDSTFSGSATTFAKDSSASIRSLRNTTNSLKDSASKVATLTSTPDSSDRVDLVSNPAAKSSGASGFKILKQPTDNTIQRKIPCPNLKSRRNPNTLLTPVVKPDRVADLDGFGLEDCNDFKPINSKPRVVLPRLKAELPKPEPSNEEKSPEPIDTPPVEELSTEDQPAKDMELKVPPITAPPIEKQPPIDDATKSVPQLSELSQQTVSSSGTFKPHKTDSSSDNELSQTATVVEPKTIVTPSPIPGSVRTVSLEQSTWIVKSDDSFWSIAQSSYGDGRFFRALYEVNRRNVSGFENLKEGTVLELPPMEDLVRDYPELCPHDAIRDDPKSDGVDVTTPATPRGAVVDQRLYETKPQDTLFGIARNQLGQASRYVELIELNQSAIDPHVTHLTELPSGLQLILPEK